MSKHYKILLGGSPCTHWSIAQKNNRETEPGGLGWELFKNYLYARDKFKPDYFLYENNKSMAKPIRNQIDIEFNHTYAENTNWELIFSVEEDKGHTKRWLWRNKTTGKTEYITRILINAALVSAQTRQRYYWTNIPDVPQPQDRGIVLKDILESGIDLTQNEKSYALTTRCSGAIPEDTIEKHRHSMVAEPIRVGSLPRPNGELSESQAMRIYSVDGKSVTQSAQGGGLGAKTGLYAVPINDCNGKAHTIKAQYYKNGIANFITNNGFDATAVAVPIEPLLPFTEQALCETADKYGYLPEMSNPYNRTEIIDKSPTITACSNRQSNSGQVMRVCPINVNTDNKCKTLTANYYKSSARDAVVDCAGGRTLVVPSATGKEYPVYTVENGLITIKDKQYPIKLPDGYYIIRKLTVNECRRLQTIPDWYKMPCSASQNYKMLGNGWTVEVIKHILSYIPDIKDCTVEVLSMYDGMSCGQITLVELGCQVERYVSYEIDKYAIQTTQANFARTEQRGDAFQVRQENWKY